MKKIPGSALIAVIISPAAIAAASSTGGSGQSTMACTGGPPDYCARTDLATQPFSTPGLTLGPTGYTGVAFVDPDFGERVVRVTDSNTEALHFGCCVTRDSAELQLFGKEDSTFFSGDGGHRFFLQDGGSGNTLWGIDAKTMAICQFTYAAGGCSPGTGNIYGLSSSNRATSWEPWGWSENQPTVVYGSDQNSITDFVKYDTTQDRFYNTSGATSTTIVPFVDFSKCPNLPSIVGASGASYTARQDRYFSAVLGGTAQNYYVVVWKDNTGGNCYWYDTFHGIYGGTGMTTTYTTDGMVPTPGAPTLSTTLTGSDTVCAEVTANTLTPIPDGSGTAQTLPSPETCIASDPSATITLNFASGFSDPWEINLPGCASDTWSDVSPCKPYKVYMDATGSGNEVLQTTSATVSGPSYMIAVSSIQTGTAHPPTVSTAGFTIHQGIANMSGGLVALQPMSSGSIGYKYWTPTQSLVGCPGFTPALANGSCGSGHAVSGYGVQFIQNGYPGGSYNGASLSAHIFTNPYNPPVSPFSAVCQTCVPSGFPGTTAGGHLSWNNDNSSDSEPFEATFYPGITTGNGSLNLNSNPCTQVVSSLIGEELAYSVDGSNRIFRFAHNRGGSCGTPNGSPSSPFTSILPIGQISQDGALIAFQSTWGWALGSSPVNCVNDSTYPSTGWQASHSYAAHACIFDGTNYEVNEGSAFTSGGTQPTWPGTSGGTVLDGTGTWTMNTGCTDTNNPSYGETCRTDAFIVEAK